MTEPVAPTPTAPPNIRELVITLFELGREITAVLNLDELLHKIPQLIARMTKFQAFAVYLLDPRGEELSIAYAVGYPDEVVVDAAASRSARDWSAPRWPRGSRFSSTTCTRDPRYVEAVPGSDAELVVPLRRKGRVIGALNLLSDTAGQFTEIDEMLLRQFGAHVAVAIENARLFEHAREYTSTLETLSEIGREFGAILNLDELLTRIANLTRRLIDYRTFGILLVNERSGELEMKVAVRYGDKITVPRVKLGHGLVGYAALHKSAGRRTRRLADPRYIKVVDDARSELVIPLMLQDRCIGVFDLESPELDAFTKGHVEHPDAAGEPGRGGDRERAALRDGSGRTRCAWRRRSASPQRVQAALLPVELPKRHEAASTSPRVSSRRAELGGDFYDFPGARAQQPRRRRGRRIGKGGPGGALQRVCRRAGALAHVPAALRAGALHSGRRAGVVQHHPLRAPARGVLLHTVLRAVRHQAPGRHHGQLGAAVPDPLQR